MLTAAHNIYDEQKPIRKRYPFLKFIPGANGGEAPFGEIEVEDIFAPEEYIHHIPEEKEEDDITTHDYAILILKKSMGQETGYFGLHAVAAGEEGLLEDKEIYVRGYPEIEMKVW